MKLRGRDFPDGGYTPFTGARWVHRDCSISGKWTNWEASQMVVLQKHLTKEAWAAMWVPVYEPSLPTLGRRHSAPW